MDRSFGYMTAFDENYLIPFFCDEVVPSDTMKLKHNIFIRTTPLVAPLMDNLYLDTFYFYVPTRLLWEHLEQFFGFQQNPNDSIDYLVPTVELTAKVNSLADYFGIPVDTTNPIEVNALILRAYYMIWNEWFRDENLQNSVEWLNGDTGVYEGFDGETLPLKRGKRFDYFTSSLPNSQKGEPINVGFNNMSVMAPVSPYSAVRLPMTYEGNLSVAGSGTLILNANQNIYGGNLNSVPHTEPFDTGMYVNSQFTVNQLRMAFQMQAYLELNQRSGTRFTEFIQAHFGCTVPDYRLQRPEYLGGSSTRFHINPVQQTSSTDNVTPQGNLTANGVLVSSEHGFTKSFYEPGYLIGLCSVRADLRYQQGLNKMWSRRTRFDFYDPIFANLGEQAVLSKEIYCDGTDDDELVFGYQERWAEYRFKPSMITGKMRSGVDGSLDVWHLAQYFDERPQLSSDFIEENVDVQRIVAVPSEPHFIMDCWFDYTCTRPMPLYSIPFNLGRF